jgi:hypothetical protein
MSVHLTGVRASGMMTERRTTSVSELNFPDEQLTSPPELSYFASGFRSFAAVTAFLRKEHSPVDPQLTIRTHIVNLKKVIQRSIDGS